MAMFNSDFEKFTYDILARLEQRITNIENFINSCDFSINKIKVTSQPNGTRKSSNVKMD